MVSLEEQQLANSFEKVFMGAAGSGGEPAAYLITYQGSGKIWDIQDDYADVTSTFLPSNTTSWAGSSENMHHPWQSNGYRSKYIGFGGWGRGASVGGAIWDINNLSSQWTGYNNYDGTVFNFGGTGNAIVTDLLPQGDSGNFFWFRINDTLEVGVNGITNPSSSNTGSQASQLIANTTRVAKTWGDYIVYQPEAASTVTLASFNQSSGATSNITSDTDIDLYTSTCHPAISKTGNVIAVLNNNPNTSSFIRVYDDYNITAYDGTGSKVLQGNSTAIELPSAVKSKATNAISQTECIAISDDDRWIAAGYRNSSSPYWGIVVWDRNNSYAATDITLPVGAGSNARVRGIVFYPDNDTFFVAGYANAQCVLCSASGGSYTRNFSGFGADAESVMSSAMGATVLPPAWTDGY